MQKKKKKYKAKKSQETAMEANAALTQNKNIEVSSGTKNTIFSLK